MDEHIIKIKKMVIEAGISSGCYEDEMLAFLQFRPYSLWLSI